VNYNDGSTGILEGLKRKRQILKEEKNVTSFEEKNFSCSSSKSVPSKKEGTKKERYSRLDGARFEIKRSYTLTVAANKKLQEIKLNDKDPSVTFNELIDEAINLIHKQRCVKFNSPL